MLTKLLELSFSDTLGLKLAYLLSYHRSLWAFVVLIKILFFKI